MIRVHSRTFLFSLRSKAQRLEFLEVPYIMRFFHFRLPEIPVSCAFSISGTLVRTVAPAAGETVGLSLPPGFYLVTKGGKTCKIIIQ